MNPQIDAIKERIRALRERNKQINTELENSEQVLKKDTLNAEKEQNNNEIRKERTNRYNLKQISEEAIFMKECCEHLQRVGIVKNRYQFCREFLKKSQHYLSMVICEGRCPSVDVIYVLLQNLKDVCFVFSGRENSGKICRLLTDLINRGQVLITRQIAKYL